MRLPVAASQHSFALLLTFCARPARACRHPRNGCPLQDSRTPQSRSSKAAATKQHRPDLLDPRAALSRSPLPRASSCAPACALPPMAECLAVPGAPLPLRCPNHTSRVTAGKQLRSLSISHAAQPRPCWHLSPRCPTHAQSLWLRGDACSGLGWRCPAVHPCREREVVLLTRNGTPTRLEACLTYTRARQPWWAGRQTPTRRPPAPPRAAPAPSPPAHRPTRRRTPITKVEHTDVCHWLLERKGEKWSVGALIKRRACT